MYSAPVFSNFSVRCRRHVPAKRDNNLLIGNDLVWIPEVRNAIAQFGQRYLDKIFSAAEINDCAGIPERRVASLAARFAAKEAVMKILGLNKNSVLPWRAIEVIRPAGQAPSVRLHPPALQFARQAGILHCSLSLSHEHEYAMATVIAIRKTRQMQVRLPRN
ncbi:holo-ACP synthase [Undibacterium rugosum]|uniref:Holo-[acyl-carrier-protein] synthase n=1 Tax=Undibacterium rugosum TaxID=2762291 RepID=A0A923HY62_9BURK|nr:holo-ACP synthase [Undibacterium rugosum]MBC3934126.1 holo-ACP synthase [Undibacterium rugosum]MBR7779151.1 holo-ACP synthase [Undibacterium rugosum]